MIEKTKIRCLLVDDHAVVREGLAAILAQEEDLVVVGKANNGREAIDLFRLHKPHIVVMDLRMPEIDGIAATLAIRAEFPQARIIIFTTYDDEESVYQAVRAGASGYLLKSTIGEDLMQAIRAVHRGEKVIAPELTMLLIRRMSSNELTLREREILGAMAIGRSNQEIAVHFLIAESTVKSHVTSIFSKLDVHDRTQAVVAALARGIIKLSQ